MSAQAATGTASLPPFFVGSKACNEILKRSMGHYMLGHLSTVANCERDQTLHRSYQLLTEEENGGSLPLFLFTSLVEITNEVNDMKGSDSVDVQIDAQFLAEARDHLTPLRQLPSQSLLDAGVRELREFCIEALSQCTPPLSHTIKELFFCLNRDLNKLKKVDLAYPLPLDATGMAERAALLRRCSRDSLCGQPSITQSMTHLELVTCGASKIVNCDAMWHFIKTFKALRILYLGSPEELIREPAQDTRTTQEAFAEIAQRCDGIIYQAEHIKACVTSEQLEEIKKAERHYKQAQDYYKTFFKQLGNIARRIAEKQVPPPDYLYQMYHLLRKRPSEAQFTGFKWSLLIFDLETAVFSCLQKALFHCLKSISPYMDIAINFKEMREFSKEEWAYYIDQVTTAARALVVDYNPQGTFAQFQPETFKVCQQMTGQPVRARFLQEELRANNDENLSPHLLPYVYELLNTLFARSNYWTGELWLTIVNDQAILEVVNFTEDQKAELLQRREHFYQLLKAANFLNIAVRAYHNRLHDRIEAAWQAYLQTAAPAAAQDAALLKSLGEKVSKVIKSKPPLAPVVQGEITPSSDEEETPSDVSEVASLFTAISVPSTEPPSAMAIFYTTCETLQKKESKHFQNLELFLLHSEELAKRPFGVDRVYSELNLARRSLECVLDALFVDPPPTHNLKVLAEQLLKSERIAPNVRNTIYESLSMLTLLAQSNEALHYASTSRLEDKQLRNFLRLLVNKSRSGKIEDLKESYTSLLQNIQGGLLRLMQAMAEPKEEPLRYDVVKLNTEKIAATLLPLERGVGNFSAELPAIAEAKKRVFEKIDSIDKAKLYIDQLLAWIGMRQKVPLPALHKKRQRDGQLENAKLLLFRLKENLTNEACGLIDSTLGRLDLVDRLIRSLLKAALLEHQETTDAQLVVNEIALLAHYLAEHIEIAPPPSSLRRAHKVTQYPSQNREREKAGELFSVVDALFKLASIERRRMADPEAEAFVFEGASVSRRKHEQQTEGVKKAITSKYLLEWIIYAGHLVHNGFITPALT